MIVTSEAGYALDVGPDDLDAARFEQLVAKGRRLLEEGETALASSTLSEALQLRRGEPLSGFAYAGFADAERAGAGHDFAEGHEHQATCQMLAPVMSWRIGKRSIAAAPEWVAHIANTKRGPMPSIHRNAARTPARETTLSSCRHAAVAGPLSVPEDYADARKRCDEDEVVPRE